MKLRNILEGLPEAQFNAEEYMNLYTCVPCPPCLLSPRARPGPQCLSLSSRVPLPRRCPAAAGGHRNWARIRHRLRRALQVAAGVLAGVCRRPLGGVGGKPYRGPPATSP
jgi:hypothetical protein